MLALLARVHMPMLLRLPTRVCGVSNALFTIHHSCRNASTHPTSRVIPVGQAIWFTRAIVSEPSSASHARQGRRGASHRQRATSASHVSEPRSPRRRNAMPSDTASKPSSASHARQDEGRGATPNDIVSEPSQTSHARQDEREGKGWHVNALCMQLHGIVSEICCAISTMMTFATNDFTSHHPPLPYNNDWSQTSKHGQHA
jgi:hypothetical protein